ncbi:MAG: flavodoxin FldA [Psittacicella sp.]
MSTIGIFYGSDTGNTEKIANSISKILNNLNHSNEVFDISESGESDISKFKYLLLGVPTWYYGESQCDWDDFYPTLKKMNLKDKKVAIFGCGDQEDYAEYFCDAIGEIYEIAKEQGAQIVGFTQNTNYHFEESRALLDDNTLVGLCIDEDRQPELTDERISNWTQAVIKAFNL